MNFCKVNHFFFSAGLFFLYLCCFSLPISSSLMSLSTAGLGLCWLLSAEVKKLPALIKTHRIVLPPLLLFAMLFTGILYSEANWGESLMIFKKYRELLYFPIVLSFLFSSAAAKGNQKATDHAKLCFLAGVTTLMLISYSMYFGWINSEKFGHSTIHHITHSFFMALLAFWAMLYALRPAEKLRWKARVCLLTLFLLAVINLFFITPGRTGMATFVLLSLLFITQKLKPRQIILSTLLTMSLLTGLYYSSPNVSNRVDEAIQEIQHYTPGNSRTSLGMRFDWWHNSLTLLEESPVFGHGTGSFATAQKRLVTGTKTALSDNPHNEYLLMGVQLGAIGIALFLLLLSSLFLYSFKLPKENRYLLQGAVLGFAWGCLANSWLLDSHPSHFLLIISAVLCSDQKTL